MKGLLVSDIHYRLKQLDHPAPIILQRIGDDWVRAGKSAVLEVPSSVVSMEKNFLINPTHADFKRISIIAERGLGLPRPT